ncbi:hypothetical protein [Paenibacillus sp. H1-7]|uniref:hypothetical protein n=1 Tax=Paenibacillus sp. H1-7 TaxID=2282849 RepID=UPI001EF8CB84|nr:hypothetical protein [Paenibacillus sp. H1-7]
MAAAPLVIIIIIDNDNIVILPECQSVSAFAMRPIAAEQPTKVNKARHPML